MEGTLLFREDFGGNDPNDPAVSMESVPGMDPSYTNSGNSLGSGHYSIRKEGWHNGIQWHWQDDHTYFGDKTRGYLLEVDGIGGHRVFYTKTIEGLVSGSEMTFSAYVVNVHYAGQLDYFGDKYIYPRLKFVLKNPETGALLAEKSTGDIQPDWRYGTPETWQYARDNQLSAEWQLVGMNFTVPEGLKSIRMFIYDDVSNNGSGNDFALDDIEIHLCRAPIRQQVDTTVCDTLLPLIWQGRQWTGEGTQTDTLRYTDGKDSVYTQISLHTQKCCPEVQTVHIDTLVCDSLLPFEWQGVVWEKAGVQEINIPHPKWTQCIDTNYIVRLETYERLWPLIVNKYNWQLLLDNVKLRQLFPESTACAFQWYKDDEPIPGATEDDYSEQNELNGRFQLRIELDDDQTIWSNILTILPTETEMPIETKVYNWQNLYLIRYEQGDKVWTEKRLIP